MPNTYDMTLHEALRDLHDMVTQLVTWPHRDCPAVQPTFNICPTCKLYCFCRLNMSFLEKTDNLDKMAGE